MDRELEGAIKESDEETVTVLTNPMHLPMNFSTQKNGIKNKKMSSVTKGRRVSLELVSIHVPPATATK